MVRVYANAQTVCVIVCSMQHHTFTSSGNTKGGSITVLLTSCLTGLDLTVFQIKTKIVSSHTTDSKTVKQEVNGTVILSPVVFPDLIIDNIHKMCHPIKCLIICCSLT
jgi:hypothetical protein